MPAGKYQQMAQDLAGQLVPPQMRAMPAMPQVPVNALLDGLFGLTQPASRGGDGALPGPVPSDQYPTLGGGVTGQLPAYMPGVGLPPLADRMPLPSDGFTGSVARDSLPLDGDLGSLMNPPAQPSFMDRFGGYVGNMAGMFGLELPAADAGGWSPSQFSLDALSTPMHLVDPYDFAMPGGQTNPFLDWDYAVRQERNEGRNA